MKKNFSQPFDHTRRTTIYFLIEVEKDAFIHFNHPDESQLDYYNGLSLEVDESQDYTSQLVKYLYEKGFSLNHYRELTRETKVVFSFVDDTPGYSLDETCFYTSVDRLSAQQDDITTFSLNGTLERFEKSPDLPRVSAFGLAQLYIERKIANT